MSRAVMSWLAAGFLILGACGGATTPAEDAAGATTSSSSTSTSTTTTTTTVPVELSLSDFLPGWGGDFDEEAAQQDFVEREKQVQEQVADCMAAEGFEYIPFVPDEGAFFAGPFDDENFTETYGFGISTFLLEDPFEEQFDEGDDPWADDPNFDIVESLTDAEREEYYFVLHGPEPDIDWENSTEEEIDEYFATWQPTGCMNEAQEEAFGGEQFFLEFDDAFSEMFERIEADPRIVGLQAQWSSCMAEAGHTFENQEEMYFSLQDRMDEVVTWPNFETIDQGEPPDFESMTDEEIEAYYEELDKLYQPQYDEAELLALNEEEISIAIADKACNADFEEVYREVQAEYEQQFIDENRTALEAFLADREE